MKIEKYFKISFKELLVFILTGGAKGTTAFV